MAKKNTGKTARYISKKQQTHWEREGKRQKIIGITGIAIIAAVIILMVVGWLLSYFIPMNSTVITVNSTGYSMGYYINMLRDQTIKLGNPSYISLLTNTVISQIEQAEIIRLEAAKLGITVSDKEVNDQLKKDKLERNAINRDITRYDLLLQKLLDEKFDKEVSQTAEQRQILAMLLESRAQADDIRTRLEKGESFTAIAEKESLQSLAGTNKGDFDWHPKDVFIQGYDITPPADFAFSVDAGILSQPIEDENVSKNAGYWLIKVVEFNKETQEATVQAILCGSMDDAVKARARLEAGEDFATVAKEVSKLDGVAENGGELGTIIAGQQQSKVFDEYVFKADQALNVLSQPLRDIETPTTGGYWLVSVAGKETDRTITAKDRDLLKQIALNAWAEEVLASDEYVVDHSKLDEDKLNWAVLKVVNSLPSNTLPSNT